MPLIVEPEPVPLTTGPDGVARIGATRVTLDSVVGAFGEGATAEEILQRYPVFRLADVYSVIGYYLRHQPEVDSYLSDRQREADKTRYENELRFDPHGVRNRLLARRTR